jgi:hypothetical protein
LPVEGAGFWRTDKHYKLGSHCLFQPGSICQASISGSRVAMSVGQLKRCSMGCIFRSGCGANWMLRGGANHRPIANFQAFIAAEHAPQKSKQTPSLSENTKNLQGKRGPSLGRAMFVIRLLKHVSCFVNIKERPLMPQGNQTYRATSIWPENGIKNKRLSDHRSDRLHPLSNRIRRPGGQS